LAETLASVLSQALPPEEMHIEVVDDGSDDTTESIVNQMGQGRISYYRNSRNLGLVGNWNACIERATGHWIHILHQDDIILDGFYRTFKSAIEAHIGIGAVFCRYSYMDEHGRQSGVADLERTSVGILENWLEKIAVAQLIQFPAMVVKRSVYEGLGGFCAEAHFAADWEMWKRIARYYPVCYVPDVLASYRRHTGSESTRMVHSGKNMTDIRTSIAISKAYLPENFADKWSQQALEHYALDASADAREKILDGYWRIGMIQLREALKTCCSIRVLLSVFSVIQSGLRTALKSPGSILKLH